MRAYLEAHPAVVMALAAAAALGAGVFYRFI